ncbi:protease inhibitor I9 family protein [Piscibacillus salipiscarius]|uniref:protease inhibitor I9 family protein n=1 Tax=Piscibacillus salipiscarius TaxID=299480 RepID=UPI0006D10DC9|nr:protease inhibitor I9 family protein [Piscibacillus salipiscarius]
MKEVRYLSKKAWLVFLSVMMLLAMSSPIQASPEGYKEVNLSSVDGKISQDLLPKGAKMDEKVEVIIQFDGDPVLKEFTKAKKQGYKMSQKAQKEHAKGLNNKKKNAKALIAHNNGKVIDSFEKIYNGLYAQVERGDLNKLSKLDEVAAIYPVKPVELHNDTSVPFIGAPDVWEKVVDGVNITGEGISVAIIDTGIDYTHASFGGEGTTEAYQSNDPDVVEEDTFPTAKVVGGWDLLELNMMLVLMILKNVFQNLMLIL